MKKHISIEGMSCKNCVKHVTNALAELDGVNQVEVSLEHKSAIIVTTKELPDEKIIAAIEDAGYTVTSIK